MTHRKIWYFVDKSDFPAFTSRLYSSLLLALGRTGKIDNILLLLVAISFFSTQSSQSEARLFLLTLSPFLHLHNTNNTF